MNPPHPMMASEYTSTDCGQEVYRMRHSTTIGGTKRLLRQPDCENGFMPIRNRSGLNLRNATRRNCGQIRLTLT